MNVKHRLQVRHVRRGIKRIKGLHIAGPAVASLWTQIIALIKQLLASGSNVQQVEAAVANIINATTLPAFLKALLIEVADTIIASLATPANKSPRRHKHPAPPHHKGPQPLHRKGPAPALAPTPMGMRQRAAATHH
jgi:hypothetical protein